MQRQELELSERSGARDRLVAPEQQTNMGRQEDQAGASVVNSQTWLLGVCYEKVCCCCAVFGMTANMVTIDQGSVGVCLQFGKFDRLLPPGRHFYNIMAEEVKPIDLKVVCLDIAPQAVMTKDNLSVTIDGVCYYRVFDAAKAAFNVENYRFALAKLAQVTLRTVLGENTLAEIFAERSRINGRVTELIDEASDPWGIKVERVELKSIDIGSSMERAMAAVAESQQEAEAKIIQAKAQRDAADILAEAADKMQSQPDALKLQWFETLRVISTQGRNTTIIVPDGMGMPPMAALPMMGQK